MVPAAALAPLLAATVPAAPRTDALSCPACELVLAQVVVPGTGADPRLPQAPGTLPPPPPPPDPIARERELSSRIADLDLRLRDFDAGWPASALVLGYLGFTLTPIGFLMGALLLAVALPPPAYAFLAIGGLGGVCIIVSLVAAAEPAAAARHEKDLLREERTRAEAELRFLRAQRGALRSGEP